MQQIMFFGGMCDAYSFQCALYLNFTVEKILDEYVDDTRQICSVQNTYIESLNLGSNDDNKVCLKP